HPRPPHLLSFPTRRSSDLALTVTLKAVPVGCAVGVPVLPVAVPGAAVSPGARICSLANVPAFTWIAGLVLAVFVPSVTSLAVIVDRKSTRLNSSHEWISYA